MPLPAQATPSSYTWGQLIDFTRRQGAASVHVSAADQLMIARKVSSAAYTKYPWPFTLGTTPLGSIQCQNGVQDYPQPDNCYRLTRAWLNVPTQNLQGPFADGTVPPYDDPSYAAYQAAVLSANFVAAQGNGGGTPVSTIWPPSGGLAILKRLDVSLYPYSYTAIRSICQQPNQNLLRLNSATSVPDSQPFSLELEYQIQRPIVNALTEPCWFPDDYLSLADEGILYYLYKFNNDPRAGVASFSADGQISYSGQYAVWMAALETAAAAERSGSVNAIVPTDQLGSYGTDNWNGWWI